jgi:sialidase-1
MKMFRCLIAFFLLSSSLWAQTDTLFVYETRTPLLVDRSDNELLFLRIESKGKGNTFNQLKLRIGEEIRLSDIKAIKVYYAGTDAPERKKNSSFVAATYVPAREADLSYSVVKEKVKPKSQELILTVHQKLFPGDNYFWISVEMKPKSSLLSLLKIQLTEATVNDRPVVLQKSFSDVEHRMGLGVRYPGDDGSVAFRIPGLVTTKKGTLLGVYDVRYKHSGDLQADVNIGLSRSTDKGQTWEKMRVIMDMGEYDGLPEAQNGIGDPSILVDEKNGTIWTVAAWTHGMGTGRAWTNSLQGMAPEETAQLMLTKSEDDGKSWSPLINITAQVKDPSWHFLLQGPGRGITMSDGTLVFPIQFIDKDRIPNAGIMYSKDRGQNWKLHNPARSNTTEAQVCEVEPGVLMLNMRDNRGGSRAVSITRDLGQTWEEHPSSRKALREPVCMASLIKVDAADNVLGKKILLFSNPDATNGRYNMTIKASLDGGLTWPYQLLLDAEENWGYSCLSMVDNETVGILYESSQTHMVFQRIKLTDLIK